MEIGGQSIQRGIVEMLKTGDYAKNYTIAPPHKKRLKHSVRLDSEAVNAFLCLTINHNSNYYACFIIIQKNTLIVTMILCLLFNTTMCKKLGLLAQFKSDVTHPACWDSVSIPAFLLLLTILYNNTTRGSG